MRSLPLSGLLLVATLCGPLLIAVPVRANSMPVAPTAASRARDQVFALLEARSGLVEHLTRQELLEADPDEELWQHKRLEAAGDDLRAVAGLLHLDLQKAEALLASRDKALQRRGLLLAGNAVLYVRLFEDDDGDARLRAALYEGFLLPFIDLAPAEGGNSRFALLEGGAVALGVVGNGGGSRAILETIVKTAPKRPQSDIARVHLADALAGAGVERYYEAYELLEAVETPDLEGAKARSQEMLRKHRAQQRALLEKLRAARTGAGGGTEATGPQSPAAPTPATTGGAGAGGAGGANMGGLALPGQRLAQATGGGNGPQPAGETGEEALPEDADAAPAEDDTGDDVLSRARRAAKAAQKASLLTRKAQDAATISLARLLDAVDAQQAYQAAIAPPAAPGRRVATDRNAPVVNPNVLKAEAEAKSGLASQAAAEAQAASLEAQEATKVAAKLALLVHNTPAAPIAATTPPKPADDLPTAVEVPAARPLAPTP